MNTATAAMNRVHHNTRVQARRVTVRAHADESPVCRVSGFVLGRSLAFGIVAGCSLQQPKPPVAPSGNAETVMAADFDGDGQQDLVALHDGHLQWLDHKEPFAVGLAAHAVADIDADGREELVVASRGRRGASPVDPQILVVDELGITEHPLDRPNRFRIAGLSVYGGRIFASLLGPNKVTTGGWWTTDGFTPVTESLMGLTQAPLPNGAVAVGRIYGDKPRSDGQLELHLADGTTRVLPGYRGVRSLATADLNRDGHPDLLSADGWHFQYGEHASARLNVYFGPDYTDHRVIGTIDGDYTINRIEAVTGTPAVVVATGTSKVVTFTSDPMGWTPITIGTVQEGGLSAVVRGADHHWIAIPGKPIGILSVNAQ